MTIQYDHAGKPVAIYYAFTDNKVSKTIELGDFCHVDLDQQGNLRGIELLETDAEQLELIKVKFEQIIPEHLATINRVLPKFAACA